MQTLIQMRVRYYYLLLLLLFAPCVQLLAAERIYNVLFIQSYTNQTPWNDDLTKGLRDGFVEAGVKVNLVTEYLDADYWRYASEKVIMQRFCQRAKARGTDLIVAVGDEAFHTLFNCGDSLARQIPVVFFGVKYPNQEMMKSLPNVCGFTSTPDFAQLLEQAHRIFPQRKEVVCITDNSFLSNAGKEQFLAGWEVFKKTYPDYKLSMYNAQADNTNAVIASICYIRNSYGRLVIVPKWSSFLSFLGKNSKAPFFSCQSVALTNGAFCAYDALPLASARMAGLRAAKVLQGVNIANLGVMESPTEFIYDYKQLGFFRTNSDKVNPGIIVNEPYWEKYQLLFILLYASIITLLIVVVVWLIRVNRRESRRRMHAQTRLLIQNRLVAQRDEFDNVFHSIRDGVITYDSDFRIHFTNRSLLKMLHLPQDEKTRPYEGMPAGTIFRIFNNGEEILHCMLKQVLNDGNSLVIPENSFMQEIHSGNYFLVSGELVPIRTHNKITGIALSFRNVSDEEMQKRFFNLAVEESSIYPWQFNVSTGLFTFAPGFLKRFGFDEGAMAISRKDVDQLIHKDDIVEMRPLFDEVLAGKNTNTRMSFRQRNANGEYEWWEYRTSVLKGLHTDMPYSILGVCQSIQRYKSTEEALTIARDRALQADKLKSAFLANMSHEIRTPLNAIVGFSDLLSDTSLFSAEEVSQFIATINKNCSLLLALINDILDMSRIESGTMDFQFSNHNLSLILRTVYDSQQLNMPSGVKLVLDIPPGEKKYLITDNVRLQQVVNNLINNAAKFTTSGSITLGFTEDEPDYTTIFVEDTGVGITQEGLDHIFERFYKVDSFTQGAGLGLSICRTIVERLKGEIRVTSQVGKGTRFSVRIPNDCE